MRCSGSILTWTNFSTQLIIKSATSTCKRFIMYHYLPYNVVTIICSAVMMTWRLKLAEK